ncbi:hypothetical protein HY933_02415 [Candidatus Falkowbacteria bacterium]|nr:hypothetical protein [Candidatus Falkowbacteria bacterium]
MFFSSDTSSSWREMIFIVAQLRLKSFRRPFLVSDEKPYIPLKSSFVTISIYVLLGIISWPYSLRVAARTIPPVFRSAGSAGRGAFDPRGMAGSLAVGLERLAVAVHGVDGIDD